MRCIHCTINLDADAELKQKVQYLLCNEENNEIVAMETRIKGYSYAYHLYRRSRSVTDLWLDNVDPSPLQA